MGGYPIREIDAEALVAWLQEDDKVAVIDVRSEAECTRGLIPRGEPLPLHLLPLRITDVPIDRPVVFYCRTGARSAQACMYLAQRGFGNVYNLQGGIVDWARRGLPIVEVAA